MRNPLLTVETAIFSSKKVSENWKDVYLSMDLMDCMEVNEVLCDKKIRSKIVNTAVIKHYNPSQPFQRVGCSKVTVLEEDYEKSMKIINENGFKSDLPITDDSPIEHSIKFPKQN